jgi:hypothetical protein
MSNPSRNYRGRYDYSKDMHLMCVCGHKLGVHAGDNDTGKRPCFNEDSNLNDDPELTATGEYCPCKHFRKARSPQTKEKGNRI